MPLAAMLDHDGAHAPRREGVAIPPHAGAGPGRDDRRRRRSATIAAATRSGSIRLAPEAFAGALNRDILVPRPAGRFLFGRLIGREERPGSRGKLHILPLGAGQRQTVVTDPPWAAVAVKLIRRL